MPMGGRRGLTMIEMLVVVALLAAIAALAFPAFEGWADSSRMESAVAQIEAGVARARVKARQSGKPVEVRLASEGGGAAGSSDASDESSVDAVEVRLQSGLMAERTRSADAEGRGEKASASGGSIASGAAGAVGLVVCLPDGTSEIPGPTSLVLKGRTVDLAVSRWTGAVVASPHPTEVSARGEREQAPVDAKAGGT
jgi:prepilin-type N-terminal cleavage/methylation domain-containing protein